jgi:hypothetical protein
MFHSNSPLATLDPVNASDSHIRPYPLLMLLEDGVGTGTHRSGPEAPPDR